MNDSGTFVFTSANTYKTHTIVEPLIKIELLQKKINLERNIIFFALLSFSGRNLQNFSSYLYHNDIINEAPMYVSNTK